MNRFGINLIWVALRDYLPGSVLGTHVHPDGVYHYIYVLQGGGGICIGRERFDLAPGKMYLTAPDVPHDFFSKEDAPLITVEFKFTIPDKELDLQTRDLPPRVDCRNSALQMLVPGMWREMERKKNRSEEILCAQAYEMLCLLQRTVQEERHGNGASLEELQSVFRFINTHLGSEITLADLAEAAHLEKTYFTKKFKRLTGTTPMEYVRSTRIEKAKDLLEFSDMSITQIAEALGFQSLHHFSNMFLKYTGSSPRKYKRALEPHLVERQ